MAVRIGFSLQGRGALAEREAITTLAQRADALGYDSIRVSDRLLIPAATAPPLTNSAPQIAEDLSAYVAAGVEHFVLDFSVGAVPEMLGVLERLMIAVKPRIRS